MSSPQPVMGGFWERMQAFGESAFESIGEKLGTVADGYLDYQTQKWANVNANPQVQKEAEPVKGKTVEGKPIVVPPSQGFTVSNNTLLIGGGVALVLVAVLALRK